ncbi:MAG: hypothetical protein NTX79_01325 [Candidatus Micrarchaeota archaeon]|nr:hypothetical protein [Candidatus Micrarchaeota archaeon]
MEMNTLTALCIVLSCLLLFGCAGAESTDNSQGGESYDYSITHPQSLSDCGSAKDSEDRNICTMYVGRGTKDASVCATLPRDNYRFECYSGVVIGTGDVSICENLGGSDSKECFSITAAECCAGGSQDNPDVCSKIAEKGYEC